MPETPRSERPWWVLAGGAGLLIAGMGYLAVRWLALPGWVYLAFLASFPIYALGLRGVAAARWAAWARALDARLVAGAVATPAEALPDDLVAAWYYPPASFLEHAADRHRDAGHASAAADLYDAARRSAPPPARPRLARQAWASLRKLEPRERDRGGRWASLLEDAIDAADPPPELHLDLAEILLARPALDEARRHLEAALAGSTSEPQRARVLCRLAVAEARSGRFGAADAYLVEAADRAPTGDPGHQALHDRATAEVALAKQAKRGELDLLGLVSLGRPRS